jgi:hypothetical protein
LETEIVARPRSREEHEASLRQISDYTFECESLILEKIDFQLNQPNGYDILSLVLNIANPTYDFSPIME